MVCPVILALPVVVGGDEETCRPVSAVIPIAHAQWLKNCQTSQFTCVVKGERQRYKVNAFSAAAFVIAQV